MEGLFKEQAINIYEIKDDCKKPEPFKVIETGCKGFSAAWVGKDRIYMAFMGSIEAPCVEILVYSLEYELIERIKLDDTMLMISSMTLSTDEKYLICAHLSLRITFIDTSSFKVTKDSPFDDDCDCIWRVAVTDGGKIVFATSDGLYTGKLTSDGEFEAEAKLLKGCNVERSQVVHGEFIMCAVK